MIIWAHVVGVAQASSGQDTAPSYFHARSLLRSCRVYHSLKKRLLGVGGGEAWMEVENTLPWEPRVRPVKKADKYHSKK